MGRRDQPPPGSYPSLPPETGDIDDSWDEFGLAGAEFRWRHGREPIHPEDDESFGDRVTAVPDIPMSELAAGLLAATDRESSTAPEPPARGNERESVQAATTRRGDPLVRSALSSPAVPRFAAPLPSDEPPRRESGPPSWTEPDLEFPISSSLDVAPEPAPGKARPQPEQDDLDFDAAFAAHPLTDVRDDRQAAGSSRMTDEIDHPFDDRTTDLGPPRDEQPTLELADDLEDPPEATRRGSDAVPPRDAPAWAADGARTPSSRPAGSSVRPLGHALRHRTGLELASEPPAAPAERTPHQELHDRYAVGDFTGALIVAESILELDPEDLEATRFAQSCRDVLTQMYGARVGALDAAVRVAIPPDQIRWLSLDHRAGFLLSLVDGTSTVEEILDICGMPRLDALRLLYMLLEERVIAVEKRGR